jgi:hypothetical protein
LISASDTIWGIPDSWFWFYMNDYSSTEFLQASSLAFLSVAMVAILRNT